MDLPIGEDIKLSNLLGLIRWIDEIFLFGHVSLSGFLIGFLLSCVRLGYGSALLLSLSAIICLILKV